MDTETNLFDYKPTRAKPQPRVLHFMQIADGRFGEGESELKERIQSITDNLQALPNVKVFTEHFRKIHFGDPEPCTQWRVDMYVSKDNSATWETVMHIINSVKAVPYDFVRYKTISHEIGITLA